MDFINPTIDASTLPSIAEAEWKPLEKSYLKILRIGWLITTLVLTVLAIVLFLTIDEFKTLQWGAVLVVIWIFLVGFHWVWNEKGFPTKAYSIREHDILYRSGWMVKNITACPFRRIQHCAVHAGPLERKFGLSNITLYTAGAAGADVKIPGLPADTALSIREFVMQKITDEPAAD